MSETLTKYGILIGVDGSSELNAADHLADTAAGAQDMVTKVLTLQ